MRLSEAAVVCFGGKRTKYYMKSALHFNPSPSETRDLSKVLS